MLLILIPLTWLSILVLVVALCKAAAHSEGDVTHIRARRLEPQAQLPVVIRDRGDKADAAHGARGHFPSGVLAPPAGTA